MSNEKLTVSETLKDNQKIENQLENNMLSVRKNNNMSAAVMERKLSAEERRKSGNNAGGLYVNLPAEPQDGNIEYKLKLVDPTPERLEELTTQMKWRLLEGQGEAVYQIGVEDNGVARGLPVDLLQKSIATLKLMAGKLSASANVMYEVDGKEGKRAEVLVREIRDGDYIDLRVAVAGNVDTGKSTLVGVLTRGTLDDGRGKMRAHVLNLRHELDSGRTSSISHRIIGYNSLGEIVNYKLDVNHMTWGDIIEGSTKVITFFDLCGHERYLKTTVSGLTGHLPDYMLLLVGANMGITHMTKEHLGLALALKIPVVVGITKTDIAPEHVMNETIDEVCRIMKLRGVKKMVVKVRNEADLWVATRHASSDNVVPMFFLSSVSGNGLDLLRKYLNLLPPRVDWKAFLKDPAEVQISETHFVSGVGTVAGGTVIRGSVPNDMTMLLGPDRNGGWQSVQIRSIHCKMMPVSKINAGQAGGFALKKVKRNQLRKGMSLVDPKANPFAIYEFEAEILILYHSTTIRINYQPVVQVLCVRQSARIVAMDRELLRTGDKAIVRFRFMHRPEYVVPGSRIILREGKTKGMGTITKVYEMGKEPPLPEESQKRFRELKIPLLENGIIQVTS